MSTLNRTIPNDLHGIFKHFTYLTNEIGRYTSVCQSYSESLKATTERNFIA